MKTTPTEIWKYVTNKKQANEIFKRIDKNPKSRKEILLQSLADRIEGKIIDAELMVVFQKSRPVKIVYQDTGEENNIQTIEQAAIVGRIKTTSKNYKSTQLWVSRVFPQWKVIGSNL